jgi:hypothetical protein
MCRFQALFLPSEIFPLICFIPKMELYFDLDQILSKNASQETGY